MTITKISLDETLNIKRSADIEGERAAAIADILHSNEFLCDDITSPYHLVLSLENRAINIAIQTENASDVKTVKIPISPFKTLIKDYFIICENYYKTAKGASQRHLEAIDMGRRALHDEAAGLLKKRFEQHNIKTDLPTSRRLFTLVCVLHIRIMY